MIDQSKVILKAVVGSTAYGLDHAGSDIDYLGCFIAPTESFLGLRPPEQTYVTHEPDQTMHEVGKLVALLLKCNPTVTELLWMNEYEVCTEDGYELRNRRHLFLSAKYVRDAYLGYATQQFRKLSDRGGTFSSDTIHRTAKHARHLMRLCKQGYDLYSTGHLSVKLDDPLPYVAFGDAAAKDPTVAAVLIEAYEHSFDNTVTALPDHPDSESVNEWLVALRLKFLSVKGWTRE